MRRVVRIALAAGTVVAAALSLGTTQAQERNATPAAPPPFTMMMGDLMNTFIQPRHAKLGIAGRVGNWPLAAYSLRELRQSFAKTSAAIPRWKGLPVERLFDAAMTEAMADVDSAIGAREPRAFAEAYEKLTTGCNNCHASTDHGFIVITVPTASTFSNQDFAPKQ